MEAELRLQEAQLAAQRDTVERQMRLQQQAAQIEHERLTSVEEVTHTDGKVRVHASDEPIADELEKLADLRDRGVLTDDEFNSRKAKLLG